MTDLGTAGNPLRVAIIGAGPTGFYAADHLFKQEELLVEVDIFDRLPTPFGLVRFGVAPDHQKIKTVTKAFDRTAQHPNCRFYGYVEIGRDISIDELRDYYHQIVYTTGAQSDRKMNIPGEDFDGSHPATEFVAWYNGHPDYRDFEFDLSGERAVVVGMGNVAVDVARILSRTPAELVKTDIADYALEALANSNIKEVYILGRRGPSQAAFTNPEAKELGELAGADICILPEEAALDPLSQQALEQSNDRATTKKVGLLQDFAHRELTGKSKKLTIRFLVSPVDIFGNDNGLVNGIRLVKNELYLTEAGTLRPQQTAQFEEMPVDLVFRSVGYRGVPIPGVPFHEKWGVILNEQGRVLDPETQKPVVGEYTAGWIKRGPSGVIGTNKPDAVETVTCMLRDLEKGITLKPTQPEVAAIEKLVRQRQPNFFSYQDWLRLDEIEVTRGKEAGRPRVKFTCVQDMLAALGR
jgi:ferredoxin--NADP+ reductase